jgi:putative ubiquitin-RnfH superfamily antitoxin RatB of RatAB toxin-antitoxin module
MGAGWIHLTVVYAPAARQVVEVELCLAQPCTLAEALRQSGLADRFGELQHGLQDGSLCTGIWGRKAGPRHLLREGDRVEIYRGLKVDPKVARRLRFARQGSRATGLFAKRRLGAKAGY